MRAHNFKDLTGQKFGRLEVIKLDEEKTHPKHIFWICECECGNIVSVKREYLTSGDTKSCGCLRREYARNISIMKEKVHNDYVLHEDYYECFLSNGNSTIFDIEDYKLVKQYGWYQNNGYAYTIIENNKCVPMHYILFGDFMYDHKNHNKLDNRKNNLRKCDYFKNNQNHIIRKDNTSGVSGVNYHKRINKWAARINIDGKRVIIYSGDSFKEAVKSRLQAEKEYYGEFAPQKHLYKEYRIQ